MLAQTRSKHQASPKRIVMKKITPRLLFVLLIPFIIFVMDSFAGCAKDTGSGTGSTPAPVPPPSNPAVNDVDFWLTKADQSVLLAKQNGTLSFANLSNQNST